MDFLAWTGSVLIGCCVAAALSGCGDDEGGPSTGGNGGESATGGAGGAGGEAEGGAGGAGIGGAPHALGQRLSQGVWRFELEDPKSPGSEWIRFELTGNTEGTATELPVEAGDYFPCGGAGELGFIGDISVQIEHACGGDWSFDVIEDLPAAELPAGAIEGVAALVGQVTPMRGYRFPATTCDEAMTACGAPD